MLNFLNVYKGRKLSQTLFISYIVLFFLVISVSILTVLWMSIITSFVTKNVEKPKLLAQQIITDNFEEIYTEDVLKMGGWIEILDNQLVVAKQYGSNRRIGYRYPREAFLKLLFNHPQVDNWYYSCAYSTKGDYILLTAIPMNIMKEGMAIIGVPSSTGMDIQIISQAEEQAGITVTILGLCFFMGALGISIYIYSRFTSRVLVTPLRALLYGVEKIQAGDYSIRIQGQSVHEISRLRDAFNDMVLQLQKEIDLREESEASKKQLIMSISHDLKNPLTSVLGYSDYLLQNGDMSASERVKYIKVIYENGLRANHLMQDLFQLSYLNSANSVLSLKTQDLCEFMRELLAGYVPQLEEKDILYDFDIPEEPICVLFDEQQLDRAISNLIINAIKYNDFGNTLRVSLCKSSKKNIIVLEDNGIGIPKEFCEDIFKPFVRVDSARNSKTGGTGLGLFISKNILRKHGWGIYLDTTVPCGCRFIIEIPT